MSYTNKWLQMQQLYLIGVLPTNKINSKGVISQWDRSKKYIFRLCNENVDAKYD